MNLNKFDVTYVKKVIKKTPKKKHAMQYKWIEYLLFNVSIFIRIDRRFIVHCISLFHLYSVL